MASPGWLAGATIQSGDYPSIQAAVDAADPGDTVEIPAGTYAEEILVNKSIAIRGANAGIAAGSHPGDRGAETVIVGGFIVSASGASIDGVTIQNGRTVGGTRAGVAVAVSNVTITNSIIEGVSAVQGNGIETYASNPTVDNLEVSNSTIRNNWRGIYLNPGSGHVFRGNLIDGNNGSGVGIGSDGLSNFTLEDNVISNHDLEGWGSSAVGANVTASDNTFTNNLVSVAHYSGAAIDANRNYWGNASGAGSAVSGNVVAIAYYTDEEGGTLYAPVTNTASGTYYSTIQAAINAASPGDLIEVAAGTFSEDVALNKSVTLKGAGPGLTILSGPIGGAVNTVQISASNAVIRGFTITREGNNLADWNNPSLNSAGIGLLAPAISGVVIHDNLVTGMRTGIDINNTSEVTVRNNVVTGNHTGLILRNRTDDLLVEENIITDNRTVGILFLDASSGSNSPLQQAVGSVFRNNRITGNWYGQVVDRQAGGALPAPGSLPKNFVGNWLGSLAPHVTTANSAEPGYADLLPVSFGGTAEAPSAGSQPDIAGPGSGNIVFAPLLVSGLDTDLETEPGRGTHGFQGEVDNFGYPVTIVTDPDAPVPFQSLAEALAAAVSGDIIELSPGVHAGAEIALNKAVTIRGANAGLSGTDPDRGPESRIFNMRFVILNAGVVIDGVEIFQTNNTADAILVQAGATITNSVFRRFGVDSGKSARGIVTAVGTNGYAFTKNLFTGDASGDLFGSHKTWQSGIYLNGGSGTISGNTFENTRSAINADDFNGGITITGNHFGLNGTYLSFGGVSPTTGAYTIAGNDFDFDFAEGAPNPTLFNLTNVDPAFRLDVVGNTFGGKASADLTPAEKFAIEARNFHRGRGNRNGVVDFVAGEQIVVPGTTIQSAVDAAAPGDTVLVSVGVHAGPVNLNKNNLTLLGISHGGVKPRIETVDATNALGTVKFSPGTSGITLEGFEIIGFDGTPGLERAAVYFQGAQSGHLVKGNTITAAGESAILTEWGLPITNLTIDGNLINGTTFNAPGTGGPGGGDQWSVPNWPRALVYLSGNSNGANNTGIVFTNNVVEGISGDANNGISPVTIDGNGVTISGNTFAGASGTHVPTHALLRARGTNTAISGNDFTGSAPRAVILGNGATNSVSGNRFLAPFTSTVVNEGGILLTGTPNYWGKPHPDFAQAVTGNVAYSPWYVDPAMTILVTEDNFQDIVIPAGTTQTFDDLYIGSGATWTVRGRLVVDDQFVLEEGATLEVVDGDVTFPGGASIAGTFTFFNSFGSVNFDGDVTLTGSAEGLILVSDVHVADGVTITVEGPGSFTIDGCTVDSDGTFDLVVEPGAEFTMARTRFSDGHIEVASGASRIYDNHFLAGSSIHVAAGTNGARVYHNVLTNLASITDAGTGTIQTVDTWGNIIDPANSKNDLPLAWELAPAEVSGKRTIAPDGVAYIQPGDPVAATISVSKLMGPIVGAETLVGYNTDFFTVGTLGLKADWDVIATASDASNVIGKYDTSLFADLVSVPASGTTADQTLADLSFTAKAGVEGRTQVFHRVKLASDTFPGDTTLVRGAPVGGSFEPFTSNTPLVIVDGTAPVLDSDGPDAGSAPDHTTITQGGEDLTEIIALQGTVEITTVAFDALAGIDDEDVVVTLVGPATYLTSPTSTSAGPTIGADEWTTYGFEYVVTASTLNGVYDVVATVTDRSGNEASTVLGSIEVNKNEVTATVRLEYLTTGPVTRDVTFDFTDGAGTVLESRTHSVVFNAGLGMVTFKDVPLATVNLSAKATTHLRRKVAVVFDGNGQGTASFDDSDLSGTNEDTEDMLLGGDLNGDNLVNLHDYAILKYYWLEAVSAVPAAAAADIDGNGVVNMTDFQILQLRFYAQGDPR